MNPATHEDVGAAGFNHRAWHASILLIHDQADPSAIGRYCEDWPDVVRQRTRGLRQPLSHRPGGLPDT